jgi:hypothetical protein
MVPTNIPKASLPSLLPMLRHSHASPHVYAIPMYVYANPMHLHMLYNAVSGWGTIARCLTLTTRLLLSQSFWYELDSESR